MAVLLSQWTCSHSPRCQQQRTRRENRHLKFYEPRDNLDTSITAVSPAKPAGVGAIRVTTPGGTSPANPIALFEYAEGSWSRTGSMNTARSTHTTTLLENGKVLWRAAVEPETSPR